MPPVFDRQSPDPHPYDAALDELSTGEDLNARAIASNLRYDPRVSEEREALLDDFVLEPNSGQGLLDALYRYHRDRVLLQKWPDYEFPSLNEMNLVSGVSFGRTLHKDLYLARFLDLNSLFLLYTWARQEGGEGFEDFPKGREPERDAAAWLDRRMDEEGAAAVVPGVLGLLNAYRRVERYQPTWAVLWDEVADLIGEKPPERWLERVGLPRGEGHWIIVLKYRVREVDRLARPTVLDAGKNHPHHFPSPRTAEDDKTRYGHPVDLSLRSPEGRLRKEFIHRQIDHPESHWRDAGAVCRQTGAPTDEGLAQQRRAHLDLLEDRYGELVLHWESM